MLPWSRDQPMKRILRSRWLGLWVRVGIYVRDRVGMMADVSVRVMILK